MAEIIQGDVIEMLQTLPADSVQCVVTSPPYFALRDYGIDGQLGLEKLHDCLGWATGNKCCECYICRMVAVFREVRRVLRKDGVCFLNIGDSYAANRTYQVRDNKHTDVGNTGAMSVPPGLKPKDMCLMPQRLALALQADGWWVRQDIIWHKPNPMPESVTDRCTKAHEYIFLLTKSARYYWDQEAVREITGREASWATWDAASGRHAPSGNLAEGVNAGFGSKAESFTHPAGRNARDVWTIPTEAYPQSHFATFPQALVRKCLKAGTSLKGCCPECGSPWARVVESKRVPTRPGINTKDTLKSVVANPAIISGANRDPQRHVSEYETTGWRPTCQCSAIPTGTVRHDPIPCTVLDPFGGAGTTGLVAKLMGLDYTLIELNPEYVEQARKRIHDALPLLGLAKKEPT